MHLASLTRRSLRYGTSVLGRNLAAGCVIVLLWSGAVRAEVRILAFGDSLTQGYGLPEADGFAPQLESWLHAQGAGDVTIINGGVSGETSAGGLARIDWALADDLDAVIVALGANDMLRGLPVADLRHNLAGILRAIEAAGLPVLLAGVPVPANLGATYRQDFQATYADLAGEYGAIYYPSFFAGMTVGRSQEEILGLMQPDRLHPNAEGVRANVEAIGPVVLELVARARK